MHTPYGNGIGRSIKDQRLNEIKPSSELAYVIGSVLGDGAAEYTSPNCCTITLAVKDYDYAMKFSRCLRMVFSRGLYTLRWSELLSRWVVKVRSKRLYQLLAKPVSLEGLKPYVEHCRECMASFIRGFTDAEGSISYRKKAGIRIEMGNCNGKLLQYIGDLLNKFGIEYKIYRRRLPRKNYQADILQNKNVYTF